MVVNIVYSAWKLKISVIWGRLIEYKSRPIVTDMVAPKLYSLEQTTSRHFVSPFSEKT